MSLVYLALLTGLFALETIEAPQLEAELLTAYALNPSQLEISDESFILPSHEWVVQTFLPYIKTYFESNDLRPVGEGMDCDNLSQIFRQQLTLCNARGGGTAIGDVPCGLLKTRQAFSFGGVPSGLNEFHSLILLRTEQGWYVIEPQTQSIVPFESYPNREYVEWVFF